MLDLINQYDKIIFHYINGVWRSDIADVIMPFMRKASNWIPLYLCLLVYIFWNYSKFFWQILLFLILTVSFSDITSSHIIKKVVKRTRPCNELTLRDSVVTIVPCGAGYSFTSSHAANHYALAAALSLSIFRRKKKIQFLLFTWAATIATAQIYVGVHYPFDILCGSILGISIALILYKIMFRNIKYTEDALLFY